MSVLKAQPRQHISNIYIYLYEGSEIKPAFMLNASENFKMRGQNICTSNFLGVQKYWSIKLKNNNCLKAAYSVTMNIFRKFLFSF